MYKVNLNGIMSEHEQELEDLREEGSQIMDNLAIKGLESKMLALEKMTKLAIKNHQEAIWELQEQLRLDWKATREELQKIRLSGHERRNSRFQEINNLVQQKFSGGE